MRTYFELSSGLAKSITVPSGTCESLKRHFEEVTRKLQLEIVQHKDNPPRWNRRTAPKSVSDYVAGKTISAHNQFVRELHDDLAKWSQSPPENEPTEELTPEFAESIWYGFSMLSLAHDRWTRDFYIEEMEVIFDVLQGTERHGIVFGEKALTAKQAAAVITLFSSYFDHDDVRLDLPNGRDWLEASDETYWCPFHGCWHRQDVEEDSYGNVVCPADGCEEVVG